MDIKGYTFKNRRITVYITRKKIKNMYLRVSADNKITLSAPLNIDEKIIDTFIESKIDWINEHIIEYDKDNEVVLFGNKYKLMFMKSDDNKVLVIDDSITVYLQQMDMKDRLLKEFLEKKLSHLIHTYTLHYSTLMNIAYHHTYSIKPMKARWGSNYIKKRHIVYNSELVHQSVDFIEYVVVHELSHFQYQNHSKDFYNYLSKYMPDYKVKRKR